MRKNKWYSVKAICSECGEPCNLREVDNGIGPYEFWGQRGTHHDYAIETDCCGADGLDEFGNIIEEVDSEKDYC